MTTLTNVQIIEQLDQANASGKVFTYAELQNIIKQASGALGDNVF